MSGAQMTPGPLNSESLRAEIQQLRKLAGPDYLLSFGQDAERRISAIEARILLIEAAMGLGAEPE